MKKKNTQNSYQIVRTLGVGASCQVVMAKDRKTKQKYALKMLKKVNPDDDQTSGMWLEHFSTCLSVPLIVCVRVCMYCMYV